MKSTKNDSLEQKQKKHSRPLSPEHERKKPGYGDKKLVGPDQPAT